MVEAQLLDKATLQNCVSPEAADPPCIGFRASHSFILCSATAPGQAISMPSIFRNDRLTRFRTHGKVAAMQPTLTIRNFYVQENERVFAEVRKAIDMLEWGSPEDAKDILVKLTVQRTEALKRAARAAAEELVEGAASAW